ncbi:hypothetical protein CEXT_633611 [Caerostris extrusa]|uniref:Uncharacterized protein n=1 Tax=Caerostris extrusa TaxID=172846 RepID=A0AAV4RIL1_CAEEX|nr:hypothetical protein CEXT_633611 [Caerostris extrusa]
MYTSSPNSDKGIKDLEHPSSLVSRELIFQPCLIFVSTPGQDNKSISWKVPSYILTKYERCKFPRCPIPNCVPVK